MVLLIEKDVLQKEIPETLEQKLLREEETFLSLPKQ